MEDLRSQLRDLLADRHTEQARALYEILLRYVHRRVTSVADATARGLLGASEVEDVAAEVLFQLMTSALVRFRGETLPELLAFVRTVSDRSLWRAARRRHKERELIDGSGCDLIERWTQSPPTPDELVRVVPDTPLAEADKAYLLELFAAGSKVEYARRTGVSRAAVTQRVQRIQNRIARFAPEERHAVDAWLEQAARQTLLEQ